MTSHRRWASRDEDIERLPHGMVRSGYDADTRQYTFRDTTSGVDYVSAPGERYGTLVPAATASFPQPSRSTGRRRTLQAYDRPVIFADDISRQQRSSPQPRSRSPSRGNKSAPATPTARHHSTSTSTRKHGRGKEKRSASFSDILPAHLIASASGSDKPPPVPPKPAPYRGEKQERRSVSATDPLLQPLLPSKESPAVNSGRRNNGGDGGGGVLRTPVFVLRVTARMFGRTLTAVKGGYRSREGQSVDEEWVVV